MFNFLVSVSLRNRLFVLGATLILIVYGAVALRSLPIDVFPDLNRPTITLVAEAEGLAPEEVEQLIATARKRIGGKELRRQLESEGITVRCPSNRGLAEEAPFAYKDVDSVVRVVERAGLAARVAELRPIGVVKG